jgi:hypothetical protein
MRATINTVKSIIEKGKMYVYHKEQNNGAKTFLNTIEQQRGKLNKQNKKLCLEYANDIFGSEIYAPWLFVYCAYSQSFKEGWIPDNYYGSVVTPQLNGEYGKICNRNAIIGKLINESNSLDICYYANHLFLDTNCNVMSEDKLMKTIFTQTEKIVFKLEDSRQGKGIYFFDKSSFNINTIKQLGNGVFQKYIKQHDFFTNFTKTSVATIRLTTTSSNNGNIKVRAGYLRFGLKNETHVQSASAMRIAINIENGKLSEDAYFPNWKSTKHLPGNTFCFSDKIIPSFDKCISEVERMHSNISFIRCIGWDIIVNNANEFELIELNGGHNSITFNETLQGPCFKDLNWEKLIETKK